MATFFIELRRKGGKISKIPGAQSKPAVGQPFECAVGKHRVKARVLAVRHYPQSRFETILAQEVDAGATSTGQRRLTLGMRLM